MTARTLSLLLLLLLLAGGLAPGASARDTKKTDADDTRQEAQVLRKRYFDLEREIRSRKMLGKLRPPHGLPPENLVKFYDRQYGFRLDPALKDLTIRELELHKLEIETEMEIQEMRYGSDDVFDVYITAPADPNPTIPYVTVGSIQPMSSGVVAIARRSGMTHDQNGWTLHTKPLVTVKSGSFSFCEFDRFYGSQAADLAGTGFLVGDDLVATAGHVIVQDESGYQNFLDSVYFVFDFVNETEGVPDTVFTNDQVYKGIEVLQCRRDVRSDWAVIRLDRVVGRSPLTARHSGRVPDNAALTMLGHPLGLPQKYSIHAQVIDNESCGHFYATLDTYNLNSGSPVFNTSGNSVEGILVADAGDFEEVCDCLTTSLYRNEPGRAGAQVTRATEVTRFLDRPDSVAITCTIPAGTVIIDTDTTQFVQGDTLVVPVPNQGISLVRGFDYCYYRYYPLPGDLWEIRYIPGTTEVMMELVCFP